MMLPYHSAAELAVAALFAFTGFGFAGLHWALGMPTAGGVLALVLLAGCFLLRTTAPPARDVCGVPGKLLREAIIAAGEAAMLGVLMGTTLYAGIHGTGARAALFTAAIVCAIGLVAYIVHDARRAHRTHGAPAQVIATNHMGVAVISAFISLLASNSLAVMMGCLGCLLFYGTAHVYRRQHRTPSP